MEDVQMTTYRVRGYQRVTHEDVVTPLDSTLYDTPWQRLFNSTQAYKFSDQFIVEGWYE